MRGMGNLIKRRSGVRRLSAAQWVIAAFFCLAAALCPAAGLQPAGPAALNAMAAEQETRVYDYAGLFSAAEEADLEEEIAELRAEAGFDVAIMTTDDADGKSAQAYADDSYDAMGLGEGRDYSGILFVIDMDHRELVFSTTGEAIRLFTDERLETMLDHVYEGASAGDFLDSARQFLEDVEYYADKGIVSGQYNYDEDTGRTSRRRRISLSEILLALGVSFAVAGSAALKVKKEYNMELDQQQLANLNMAYRADSQYQFAEPSDRLLNTFVTTAIIAAAAASGSGSSGGHSSSGRSTTHHSSSGRSHGGSSRRF